MRTYGSPSSKQPRRRGRLPFFAKIICKFRNSLNINTVYSTRGKAVINKARISRLCVLSQLSHYYKDACSSARLTKQFSARSIHKIFWPTWICAKRGFAVRVFSKVTVGFFPRRYWIECVMASFSEQITGRITDRLVVAALVQYSTPLLKNER
jgi:hypothetical protein